MKGVLLQKSLLWLAVGASTGFAASGRADESSDYEAAVNSLEEVIVSARRTDENIQDVPISMTVFSEEQLASKNIASGSDLATFTPSLSANTRYSSESTSFTIRGFSQEVRTTASVATYFADVVSPRAGASVPAGDSGGPGMFFDLQNAQVLKGPQGTLFGRNTTGGAILLVPQEPKADFEGYVDLSKGNYDMTRLQAVANAPVSDSVRMRFGFEKMSRDGYIENTSGIGPRYFSDLNYITARASLIVDVADDIENYTILAGTDSSNNGTVPRLTATDSTVGLGRLGIPQPQVERQKDDDFYEIENSQPDPEVAYTLYQLINTTTWSATDDLTVKNIASYSVLKNEIGISLFGDNFEFNGVPLAFATSQPAPGMSTSNQRSITEEIQLQGSTESGISWQSGIYFELSKPVEPYGSISPTAINCTDAANFECEDVIFAAFGGPFLPEPIGAVQMSKNRQTFKSLGVYTQGSYDLTDELALTMGLRYTRDESDADVQDLIYRFPAANTPELHCLNDTGVVGAPSQCDENLNKVSEAPTWLLGLDYRITADILTYGKYARGYRQGSVVLGGVKGFQTYDPEEVDTYELGLKSRFDGAVPGTFNIAVFYNDFRDQQVLAAFSSSTGDASPNASPYNAGKSHIYGAEIDSSLMLLDDLKLDLSYAYLKTEVESIETPVLEPGSVYDTVNLSAQEGDRLTYTPTDKVTASLLYSLPISSDSGSANASISYSYTGDQLISSADGADGILPAIKLVTANINWYGIYGGPFDISLFATNLLDKEYLVATTSGKSLAGFAGVYAGEPRMFGARMRYNFGP
jgi:iron complex outermembrane receptor protein